MASNLFRRQAAGRLTGYSLTKKTRYDAAPAVTNGFFEATTASTQTLTQVSSLANTNSFFAPTVSLAGGGAQTLTQASTLANSSTFYAPTVAAGPVTLTPPLVSNASTLYAPTVAAGTVALSPSLLTNTSAFYAATVSLAGGGAQTLTQAVRFDNINTIYGPTVVAGAVTLAPSLVGNAQTFYGLTVAAGSVTLTPSRVDNASTFYAPAVTAGPVGLTVPLLTNANAIPTPTVTPGSITLAPPLVNSQNAFFFASVSGGSGVTISSASALLLYKIYRLHGLELGTPLVVTPTARTAGDLTQTVSGVDMVTVTTTGQSSSMVTNPDTMIAELAALHGITADLVVTATSRTAGSIVQSISTTDGTTTVLRAP